jgi:DNA-binding NtrC family response regulator
MTAPFLDSAVPPGRLTRFDGFSTATPAMAAALRCAEKAARCDAPLVLRGEAATGKRSLAEAIHRSGNRRFGPFLTVEAGLHATATESELFGHARGVLPGATVDRTGCLKQAEHGTCYIDEFCDLSRSAQGRLLRVLETARVAPLGSDEEEPIDVRVIVGTSRDPPQAIAEKRLDWVLYSRLATIEIQVPPLRHRTADICFLVDHLLEKLSSDHNRPLPTLEPELLRFFEQYSWPGNLCQLRECLETMLLADRRGALGTNELPVAMSWDAQRLDGAGERRRGTLAEMERNLVIETLRQHRSNRTRTAQALGISVRTLQRKLKRWQSED